MLIIHLIYINKFQDTRPCKIPCHHGSRNVETNSRIPKTLNLATDVDSRTDTIFEKLHDLKNFFKGYVIFLNKKNKTNADFFLRSCLIFLQKKKYI